MVNNSFFRLDFIGIGVQRCATTWLAECLREHPEICMPRRKGVGRFWRGEESAERLFEHCDGKQLLGEWGPAYYLSKNFTGKLIDHNASVKLIVSLRDPVQRAYSNFLSVNALQGNNWSTFFEGIQEKPEIIERGYYYKYLNPFFNTFSQDRIHVILAEDIKDNPQKEIRRLYRFLGVDDKFIPPSISAKYNNTLFKLSGLGRGLHRYLVGPLGRTGIGKKVKTAPRLRRSYYGLASFYARKRGIKKPDMDPETEKYLRDLYREDIEGLEKLIGRDLSSWKYGKERAT